MTTEPKDQSAILLVSSTLEVPIMAKDWTLTGNNAWEHLQDVEPESWQCGYCSYEVASKTGLRTATHEAFIRICPHCNCPTFFSCDRKQWPGPRHGGLIAKLPKEVEVAYEEARGSLSVNAFTGSVMLCRKILMNVAVSKGADEGLQFAPYVEWLMKEGYVPKGSDGWLRYIKDRGNEANHQIVPMNSDDARGVLSFTEQLLRNVYVLPNLVPPKPASQLEKGSNKP
ncbi:MAG: DUF4145 domain-containing protein [Chloroflexi bacterium]|nr:DUF4145 domain-containing protein [Chloroflexota bacterium]